MSFDVFGPVTGFMKQLGVALPLPEAPQKEPSVAVVAEVVAPSRSVSRASLSRARRPSGRVKDGLWLRWEGLVYEVALLKTGEPGAPTTKRILHGLNGQVLPGQLLAIMGPSGSGKTSLIKLLAGRRAPTEGTLMVNGEPLDVPSYRRASGFVAQTTVFLDTLTVRALRTLCGAHEGGYLHGVLQTFVDPSVHALRRRTPRHAGARDDHYDCTAAPGPQHPGRGEAGACGRGD